MPFVSTDPASWTEDNLDDQNRPTLQAVIDGLGLVLDKDDTRRGRYKGKSRFVKADLIRGLALGGGAFGDGTALVGGAP